MAIIPPRLDDRSFADLREELLRRIPVHAPEWTDHGAADPGIALLELFAALGDHLLYRLNRVPEAARLEFLRLLAIEPTPARPALAQVRLSLPPRVIEPVTPDFAGGSGTRLVVAGGAVTYQATEEITVLPVELAAWIKRPYHGDLLPGGEENLRALLTGHPGSAMSPTQVEYLAHYEAFPLAPPAGGGLPAPLSTAASLDGRLWLALLAPAAAFKQAGGNAAALATLRERISGRVLNLGLRVDEGLCGPTDHHRCPDAATPAADHWPLRWELSTGGFTGATPRLDRLRWLRLAVVADTTAGFTQGGTVRLRLPERAANGTIPIGNWTADSFSPPDPDLLGVGDLPPRLADTDAAARVLAWIRVARANPSDPPIRLRAIDANLVQVAQAVTQPPELLGYGDGRTGQVFTLSRTPVVAGSERVQVRGALGWENWQAVADLALAGPDDPVYRLDPLAGTLTFGDGLNGRLPLPGEAVRVQTWAVGGGVAGNLGAGRINRVLTGSPAAALTLKVTNPLPAEGGADAETVAAAARRIPRVLRHNDRAVAADDFVDLALATPGGGVGRAHVLPRHQPHARSDGVPGVVTLIVLPDYDPEQPDRPTPHKDLLRRVCAHLEPRRLVTTELWVTPPEYVRLTCSVAVEPEPGTGEETLRRQVELALRQHLAPLPPFGPDGAGWPFGRAVTPRDCEAAVLRVQGVRLVGEEGVLIVGETIDRTGRAWPASGTIALLPWQLPVVLEVRVAVGAGVAAEPLPPLDSLPPPVPVAGLPVPVGQETC